LRCVALRSLPCAVAGRFQSSAGESGCLDCQRGYYSGKEAAVCARCEILRIAPDSAATSCSECPVNAISNDVRTLCMCIAGYFMRDGKCTECTIGAKCDQPGSTYEALQTAPGYWRADNSSTTFYTCLRNVHCTGGYSECGGHRAGPLCALCQPNYHGKTSDGDCEPCPNQAASWTNTVLITMLFFAGSVGLFVVRPA
jgi:hypothetical protein